MTMDWIWLVPSMIWKTLASRMIFSTGYSLVYPLPPHDLDGVGDDLLEDVGDELLGDRPVLLHVLLLVDEPHRVLHQRARGDDLGRHAREHVLDHLELEDRLAELLALEGVDGGLVEGALHHPHRDRRHEGP